MNRPAFRSKVAEGLFQPCFLCDDRLPDFVALVPEGVDDLRLGQEGFAIRKRNWKDPKIAEAKTHGAPAAPPPATRGHVMPVRFYRIALVISLVLNVLLVTGIYYYSSIEGTLSLVQMLVGIFN